MTEGYVEHQADQGEPWGVSAMSIQLTGNEAAQMPPPPSSSLEHLQKHLEGGNAGAAMFTPAKLAWGQARLWLHSSWDLSACTAGPEGHWARSCPGSCWTSLGCSPRPSSSMSRDLGPRLRAAPWPPAPSKQRETGTVVQSALLHLGSSADSGSLLFALFCLPQAQHQIQASHPGLRQPTASLPGSAPGLTPMVDPRIAHSTASWSNLNWYRPLLYYFQQGHCLQK